MNKEYLNIKTSNSALKLLYPIVFIKYIDLNLWRKLKNYQYQELEWCMFNWVKNFENIAM